MPYWYKKNVYDNSHFLSFSNEIGDSKRRIFILKKISFILKPPKIETLLDYMLVCLCTGLHLVHNFMCLMLSYTVGNCISKSPYLKDVAVSEDFIRDLYQSYEEPGTCLISLHGIIFSVKISCHWD